nr:hypothetical protein Hi04_10k_c209_00023 [uncultured bacterium]
MASESAQMKPPLHGHGGPSTTPQFSDNQFGGRTVAQEAERSRTHNASGTEPPFVDGAAQQGSAQQTFARDARASGADARQYREQPDVSGDTNAGHRAADPGAGHYSHPFTHNYSYPPFGPPPFGYPFGMAQFWPFPPPPYFGFPPFGTAPGSVYPGMMPFGFQPFPDPSAQAADPTRAAYPYATMPGLWNMFRGLWSYMTSWWMWIFSGVPRGVPLPQNGSPSVDAMLRMATAQADLMHQMLLKAAEVADHTRKACQAFAEQGGMAYAPFGSNAAFATPGSSATARPGAPVDMDKLRQSLQTMDPVQAAQVIHAVQVVQVMDDARRRQQATGSFSW